ncbi:hypothetical protein Dimus_037860 [Dionaea muscipula]
MALTAKSAWELLQNEFRGEEKVKRVRLNLLRGDWERLAMNETESISEFYSRLRSVANQLSQNGEVLEEVRIVEKILRSLDSRFESVVIAIEEAKDTTTLTSKELLGSLVAHEEKFNRKKVDSLDQVLQAKLHLKDTKNQKLSWNSQYSKGNFRGRGRRSYYRGTNRGRGRGHGTYHQNTFGDENELDHR